MRTVIAGGREVTDRAFVMKAIDSVVSERGLKISKVLSGCARGADKIGEAWAHVKGIPVKRFPADWGRFGKAAGIVRNEEMGLEAECLIAVWDGESRGTKHMINVMRRQNLPVIVIAAPAPPKFRRVRKAGVIRKSPWWPIYYAKV